MERQIYRDRQADRDEHNEINRRRELRQADHQVERDRGAIMLGCWVARVCFRRASYQGCHGFRHPLPVFQPSAAAARFFL